MKLKTLVICGALMAAAQFGSPSHAQEMGPPGDLSQTPEAVDSEIYLAEQPTAMAVPFGPHGFFERLGLSDEQLEKLVNLKTQLAINTAQKKAQMKGKFHEMMDLLSQANVDKQKVMSLQGEINALHDDLSSSHAGFMVDASAVFTPEQKKQLHHMMLMHMMMMEGPGGDFHGPHMMHGPEPGHHMQYHHHP